MSVRDWSGNQNVQNAPSAGTQSSWNTMDGGSGASWAPNSNTLDRNAMPSDKAEAARQKSAAVMEALKAGDTAEANRLMGKNEVKQGQMVSPGPLRWMAKKFGGKKNQQGMVEEIDGQSVRSEGVEEVVVEDKKGEKVVR